MFKFKDIFSYSKPLENEPFWIENKISTPVGVPGRGHRTFNKTIKDCITLHWTKT